VYYYPLNDKKLAEIETDLRVRHASVPAAAAGG